MNQENTRRLLTRFPLIFQEYNLPVTDTAMCWGFECGDGWYWLIDGLCAALQFDIDENDQPQIVASQVKEKYGTLRFYTNSETDRQSGMIRLAQLMSERICELCGSPSGKLAEVSGWWSTKCDWCASKEAANINGS